MSKPDPSSSSLISSLTSSERSKVIPTQFLDLLTDWQAKNIDLSSLQSPLLSPTLRKPQVLPSSSDSTWDCKWSVSNTIGTIYLVSGRPLSRWGCASALLSDRLYLFGGRGADSRPRNSFHVLDLPSQHLGLFRTTNTPSGREGHSMVAYNSRLYIYGGCEGDSQENEPFEDVWVVEVEKRAWLRLSTTGKKPQAREGHAAGVIGSKMLVYGGSSTHELLSDMHTLDLQSFVWSELAVQGAILGPRESMGAVVVRDCFYIFGGNVSELESNQDEYTDDFYAVTLDGSTACCRKIITEGPAPSKRLSHSLSNLNDKYLILFGGEGHGGALNDIWTYHIEGNAWQEIRPQNQIPSRMAHVCCSFKGMVYVFGGMAQDQSVRNDLAILRFGKGEININNGSGVNLKRKFTKLLTVSSRVVPMIQHSELEGSLVSCSKCGHCDVICGLGKRLDELNYPVVNFCPRQQLAVAAVEKLAAEFQDPFAAMLRLGETIGHYVEFTIVGQANLRGSQVIKEGLDGISNEKVEKERLQKGIIFNLWRSPICVKANILEISSGKMMDFEEVAKFCSGINGNSLVPALFKLSDIAVVISKTEMFFTVAVLYKSEDYIPLHLVVFDKDSTAIYPNERFVSSTMEKIYGRTHLQESSLFNQALGTRIFLYTTEIESVENDIIYKGNSFSSLLSFVNSGQYIIGRSLIQSDSEEEGKSGAVKSEINDVQMAIYVDSRIAYWEYRKVEKRKRNLEEKHIINWRGSDLVSPVTGMLLWKTKTMQMLSDEFLTLKKVRNTYQNGF